MNRWARVTDIEDGCVLWINENHVISIKDYSTGCMVGFSTEGEDVVSVKEEAEDIFAAWDDWQSIHKGA